MHCQVCKKNEATIHLTEINDGMRTEMHLCEYCASEQGIMVKTNIPLTELLGNLLAVQPSDEEIFGQSYDRVTCPHCGVTMEQFSKEGQLGCPYDYEVFEETLKPLIDRAHDGQCVHCGKVPSKTSDTARQEIELLTLKKRLDEAVRTENYESAASLRDKIDAIRTSVTKDHGSKVK